MDAPRGHVLFAGGGTGGHVFPALAIADALRARGWSVSFAGSTRGLEGRLVPARGIPLHDLAARPFLGRGPVARVRALATLGRSTLAARRLVRRLDARVVVGTGGYVSAPGVLGARAARRPVLLVEPNARAGAANRWLSRFAAEAAVGLESGGAGLRCVAVHTGVPVRGEFFAVPRLDESTLGAAPRLLVLGGSQGAQQLNRLLPAAVRRLRERWPALAVVHQSGATHAAETRSSYGESVDPEAVQVLPFIDDVAAAMARAHVVVARAGAITLAELCAAGRPALLLPLAIAAGHQIENARALAAAGAAVALTAASVAADDVAAALADLLSDPARLSAMAAAARRLSRPGAAAAIADRVEALA
jgi:UDP-N-acetylglucosamine--N-acetylmuramyl-(pentapeptide) pyrophosphoryl-undecaprenol N-acetylglucosamine transferase